MAFTLAHPAIVLPFLKINRKYVSATGLIVGSMAPDFGHFLTMSVRGKHSHGLLSLLLLDLPVAVLVSLIFHISMKGPLIANLPRSLQSRLGELKRLNFVASLRQHPWVYLYSLLAAGALHVFWDSFTHGGGYFSKLFLSKSYFPFNGINYPMFYVLQYVTSVIGLGTVIMYVFFMKRDGAPGEAPRGRYWFFIFFTSIAVFLLRFGLGQAPATGANILVTSISACFISVFIAGHLKFKTT